MSIPKSFHNRETAKNPAYQVTDGEEFSVLTYNVLATCHVPRWDYSYTKADPKTLELPYRHEILMKEIAYLDNDIVCFQEVGPKYWKECLEADMNRLGYSGVFVRKRADSEYYDEGEATCWKNDKFSLQEKKILYLGDEAGKILENFDVGDEPKLSTALKSRYVDRPEVLLITKLQSVASKDIVVVANTHIVWGTEYITDVRALQCRCSKLFLAQYIGDLPYSCIYCGDFNSVPESLAYIFAQGKQPDGDIEKTLIPVFDGQEVLPAFQRLLATLPADELPLQSAYRSCVGKEPSLTHFDNSLPFTLDYIFYGSKTSGSVLKSLSVINIPEPETWTKTLPPDDHYPSDHLPVTGIFQF